MQSLSSMHDAHGERDGCPLPAATFSDLLVFMHTCILHAQSAAHQQRPRAAHGLFQTALRFYDCAAQLGESGRDNARRARLIEAYRHLDDCAAIVYAPERMPVSFSEELLKGFETPHYSV